MFHILTKVPTRIDIAGGTLDLWPIHQLLDHKATVNIAVALDATCELKTSDDKQFHLESIDQDIAIKGTFNHISTAAAIPLLSYCIKTIWSEDLPAINIKTQAQSPQGAGLGGSSCLCIAVLSALWQARQLITHGKTFDENELVATAMDIEAKIIRAPTGCQDYWGGVRGNINVIKFPAGKIVITTFPKENLADLNEHIVVCYSGKSRQSAINNWEIFKRVFDGDQKLLKQLNDIGKVAEQCAQAVISKDLDETLKFSKAEWELRKKLWPNIITKETETLDKAAIKAGALFSRVCGAGGGGVMAVFCSPDSKTVVTQALTKAGGRVLETTIAPKGLEVKILYYE